MSDLMTWPHEEKNIKLEMEPLPEVVQSYYCLRVGYAEKDMKAGDKLWIKAEEALRLYQLLAREFKN